MFYKLFEPDSLESWTPLPDGEEFDINFEDRKYKQVRDVPARPIIYAYEHFGFGFSKGYRRDVAENMYLALAHGAYANTMLNRNGLWPPEVGAPNQPDPNIFFLACGTPLGEDMKAGLNLFAEEAAKAFEGSEWSEEYFRSLNKVYDTLENLYNKYFEDRIPTEEELYSLAKELEQVVPKPESETMAFQIPVGGARDGDGEVTEADYEMASAPASTSMTAVGADGSNVEINIYGPDEDMFAKWQVPANGLPELSDLIGNWGQMKILDREPLTHTFNPHLKPFVTNKLNDEGVYPKRLDRLPIDGRLFQTKGKMDIAGAVLIDQSGSMGLEAEHIKSLMEMMPGVIIASYCGDNHGGYLKVLARRNRCLPLEHLVIPHGGNVVDGPALLWLMQQQGPRVWISDGRVTGVGDGSSKNLHVDVARIVRAGNIIRIPNLHQAVKAGAVLTGAIRQYMKRGV